MNNHDSTSTSSYRELYVRCAFACVRSRSLAPAAVGAWRVVCATRHALFAHARSSAAVHWGLKMEPSVQPQVPFIVAMFAGMVGGAIGVGVSYPLDSVKTKMQAIGGGCNNIFAFFALHGLLPFYDGVSSTMLGQALIKGVLFGTYEASQRVLMAAMHTTIRTVGTQIIAAGIAGGCSAFVVTPVERVKVVMQASSAATRFASPHVCVRNILEADGIQGLLFRGLHVTLLRQVPTDILYLLTFELCRDALLSAASFPVGSPLVPLMAGAAAGVMAWVPVYPIDVVKTHMTATVGGGERESMGAVAVRLWQQRGACVFCEGLAPKLARAVVNHAVTFMVMEQLKDAYRDRQLHPPPSGLSSDVSSTLSLLRCIQRTIAAAGCSTNGMCALLGYAVSGGTLLAGCLVFGVCLLPAMQHIFRGGSHADKDEGCCGHMIPSCVTLLLVFAATLIALDPPIQPDRPLPRATAVCAPEEDYLAYLRTTERWGDNGNGWTRTLQNKIIGAVHARAQGVRTPRIHFCGSLDEMPEEWPETWGGRFVVKPLGGHSSKGVLLLVDGKDIGSGRPVMGRGDVHALYNTSQDSLVRRWSRNLFIVEEMVTSYRGAVPPMDHKFYMFGDTIGGLYIVSLVQGGERAHDSCESWFAADGKTRIDQRGCVIEPGLPGCGGAFCDPKPLFNKNVCAQSQSLARLPDDVWSRLVQAAETLGRSVGVPYRVDLFVSADGTPVLGEFTPSPMNGHFHCAIPDHPINGSADPCHLGRLWGSRGRTGGPILPVPGPLQNWKQLRTRRRAQCELAKKYLSD